MPQGLAAASSKVNAEDEVEEIDIPGTVEEVKGVGSRLPLGSPQNALMIGNRPESDTLGENGCCASSRIDFKSLKRWSL